MAIADVLKVWGLLVLKMRRETVRGGGRVRNGEGVPSGDK